MTRICVRIMMTLVIMTAWVGCASQKSAPDPVKEQAPAGQAAAVEPSSPAGQSPDSFVVDPEKLEFGRYLEEEVDNFLVILDASGSKHLPYKQELKLKVAKDIVRRFNQKTPTRPLFGGLRRYGWEAGAFTTSTSLLYGMTAYNREAFAQGIEIVRWAGGKTPMAPVIEKAGDDLALAPADEYLALVIVSDGKVMKEDPNPVMAARHVKERYGDRICIYTVAVGDDFPFDKRGTPEEKRRYHEKFRLLRDVAREGKCGYMVTAEDLIPDTSMDQFVHDVFHRGRSFEPRIPELAACPDEDADSVCDDVDKCPGTPAGAKVNAEGCWDLGIVWFDLNKWNIKPEYRTMLNDIAHVLKMNRNIKLAVQGHTCTIWTEEYNMKLSHWRAMAVTSYLVSLGVNPDQLAVEGYGFHRPYVDNKTEENRSLNRRVEFRRLQ